MALQSSGAISLNDIATEFGGSQPHSISEYYGVDTGVPSSGTIAFDDFYGTSSALYSFSSHTFTSCGVSGRTGPNITQCRNAYNVTWDSTYLNMTTNGYQRWTVPATATYSIQCVGGGGGRGYTNGSTDNHGGKPANLTARFSLTKSQVIQITVGQAGQSSTGTASCSNASGGGGGGTFVVNASTGTLLLAAGGGGGGARGGGPSRQNARSGGQSGKSSSGSSGTSSGGSGGAGGSGSTGCVSSGGGGGGYTGNGGGNGPGLKLSGSTAVGGNNNYRYGGFGGGGASHRYTGGGGGGYSGGAAGGLPSCSCGSLFAGGGGGSYISGSNQSSSLYGTRYQNGFVVITKL